MSGDPIDGMVVAITGASSGIGEATARLLALRGAKLVLGARRTDRLETVVGELATPAIAVTTDVTRRQDLDAMVGMAVDTFGGLDALVSNAGVASLGPFADGDVDAWTAMIDVNLRGVLYGIAAALPVFLRQGRGHFVTTVSTAGLKIVPEMGVYAATKNAVRTVMEALRQESTHGAIRTTAISPGYVRTGFAAPDGQLEIGPTYRISRFRRTRWPALSRSPSSSRRVSRSEISPCDRRFRTEKRREPAVRGVTAGSLASYARCRGYATACAPSVRWMSGSII